MQVRGLEGLSFPELGAQAGDTQWHHEPKDILVLHAWLSPLQQLCLLAGWTGLTQTIHPFVTAQPGPLSVPSAAPALQWDRDQ